MTFISNAFSLQMLGDGPRKRSADDNFVKLKIDDNLTTADVQVALSMPFRSIVGHADIAAVMGNILDTTIAMNRESVKITENDVLIVGQYIGGRLPEGTTTLPEGAQIKWYRITIE
jgi:hypothetical protein